MQILRKSILRHGKKFNFALHHLRTHSGEEIEREMIDHPGSVVLIPRLEDGRLVMVRQYRHAVDHVMLELPAGTAEWGEALEVTAVRELAEETGYRAGRLTRLRDVFPLPGATNERMGFFLCESLKEGPTDTEIDEELTVEFVSLDDALAQVAKGEINDAKTMIGLWLAAESSR